MGQGLLGPPGWSWSWLGKPVALWYGMHARHGLEKEGGIMLWALGQEAQVRLQ